METAESEVRERGEITIPKKIRDTLHFEAGQHLEFIPLGDQAVLLAPKRLELEEARRLIHRVLKQTKVSPEKVLEGLAESREKTYQKHYAKRR